MRESDLRSKLKESISSLKGDVYDLVKVVVEEDLGKGERYRSIMSEYFLTNILLSLPSYPL